MKIKVCPVCDKEMKGNLYCRNCKSFVKNPVYWDQSYELNKDRDSTTKVNECKGHNHTRENKTGEIKKNYNVNQHRQIPFVDLNGKSQGTMAEKKRSRSSSIIVFIILFAAISVVAITLLPFLLANVSFRIGKGTKEPDIKTSEEVSVEKTGNGTVVYSDYADKENELSYTTEGSTIITTYEMDYDTICEIGLPGNSCIHYETKIEDVKKEIKKYIKANMSFDEINLSEYSYNTLTVSEDRTRDEITETTSFNTYYEWQLDEDNTNVVRVTCDSVTGNLSFITVYNEDIDVCREFARFALGLVEEPVDSSVWKVMEDENKDKGYFNYENTSVSWSSSGEYGGNFYSLSPLTDCFK